MSVASTHRVWERLETAMPGMMDCLGSVDRGDTMVEPEARPGVTISVATDLDPAVEISVLGTARFAVMEAAEVIQRGEVILRIDSQNALPTAPKPAPSMAAPYCSHCLAAPEVVVAWAVTPSPDRAAEGEAAPC